MADLKQLLQKANTRDRNEPMHFAFAVNGADKGGLVLSNKKATGSEINQAKTEAGGGTAYIGVCFNDNGKLKFETEKSPPGPARTLIKKMVREAGLSLKVAVSKAGEEEEEGPEGQGTPPQGDAAAFKDRLKKASGLMAQAVQKAPDRKGELDKIAGEAVTAYKGGDIPGGMGHLDRLEQLSNEVLTGGGTPPPPPPMADATAFKARLKQVSPVYAEAGQKAPEKKAELDKIATLAAAAAKSGDFVKALNQLDRLEIASKEALASPPPPQQPVTDEAAAFKARLKEVSQLYQDALKAAPDQKATLNGLALKAAGEAKAKNFSEAIRLLDELETASGQALAPKVDASGFKARMKEVLPVYQQAGQKAPGRKGELDQLATQAANLAKEGKYAEAMDVLDRLEAQSKGAIRQAEAVQDVNLASPVRKASFHKARDQWNQARNMARAQLQKLAQTILGDPEAQAEPDWDDIRAAADGLVAKLDSFDASLGEAVGRAAEDDPNERAAGVNDARTLISKYRSELKSNGLFQLTDGGEAYGNFNVAKVLALAIDAVDKRLAT